MNDEPKNLNYIERDYDECSIHGICSISPALSAIKMAFWAYLQEWTFYIIKVRALGARNVHMRQDFINVFAILITNVEYSDVVLHEVVSIIHNSISELKMIYHKICEEQGVTQMFFKSKIKLPTNFTIADLIKQGQKYEEKFKKMVSPEQKDAFELVFTILKSICLYIIELQDFDAEFDKYYEGLLSAIFPKEIITMGKEQIRDYIFKFAELDHELMLIVSDFRKKEFGDFIESDVLLSEKKGPAILVAGANIKELELLLEATKDRGINVYTHGQMISAHAFSKLKAYPHLVGHYGKGAEYYMSDFAAFPGVIFLTRLSLFKVDTLYSSRIFTTNKFAPKNTTSIKSHDFEPLIKAALFKDGFLETVPEKVIGAGVVEADYNRKLKEVINKIEKNEIKNIFTLGVSNKTESQAEYFKTFFKKLGKESFVISFNAKSDFKNVLYTNIDYAFPLLYEAIEAILPVKEKIKFKIIVYFTRCEPHTLPNVVYLKKRGIDRIYFDKCSQILVKPSIIDFLVENFDVKRFSSPEADLKIIFSD